MKRLMPLLALNASLLVGCSSMDEPRDTATWCVTHTGEYVQCGDMQPATHQLAMHYTPEAPAKHVLDTRFNHVKLQHYVERMALEMSDRIDERTLAPIAVASFVSLDSTLTRTNQLGNQIAEGFIAELQEFGLPVVDYKTTGMINVTPVGDFVFSRDYAVLSPVQHIGYVLSGTMSKHKGGVLVQARIVGVKSKVVLAATSQYIPEFVISHH